MRRRYVSYCACKACCNRLGRRASLKGQAWRGRYEGAMREHGGWMVGRRRGPSWIGVRYGALALLVSILFFHSAPCMGEEQINSYTVVIQTVEKLEQRTIECVNM